jgi:hypothetical protein
MERVMNIADAMKVVGRSPMKTFPWGAQLVEQVNAYVTNDKRVANTDSGMTVQGAIDSLSPEVQAHLRAREISANEPAPGTVENNVNDGLPAGFIRSYRPTVTVLIVLTVLIIAITMSVGNQIESTDAGAHGGSEQPGFVQRSLREIGHLFVEWGGDKSPSSNAPSAAVKPAAASSATTTYPASSNTLQSPTGTPTTP